MTKLEMINPKIVSGVLRKYSSEQKEVKATKWR